MSKNPKDNIDTTRSQHREGDRSTYASPKPINKQVQYERSDLYDERIERLGQYLSDTTAGRSSNVDVVTSANNNFPISGPDEPNNAANEFTKKIGLASEIFDELKRASFDADVYTRQGAPQNYQRQAGKAKDDYLLIEEQAFAASAIEKSIVQKQIEKEKTMRGSRWNGLGLGQDRFPSTSSPASENNWFNESNVSSRGNLDGRQTRFQNYTHPTGQQPGVNADQSADAFWDEYYNRMAMVGSSVTISATGRDSTSNPGERPRYSGNFNDTAGPVGHGTNDDLRGSWKLVDNAFMQAKKVFQDEVGSYTSAPSQEQKEKFNTDGHVLNQTSKSYGQLYAWDDPFDPSGFPIGQKRHAGLELAKELLEIYLYMALRTSILSAAIQVVNVALGAASAGSIVDNPWRRSYYPQGPTQSAPRGMLMGNSGYNPKVTNIVKDAPIELGELAGKIRNKFGRVVSTVALQILGGSISTLASAVNDDVLNFGHYLAKELRLYMPRHVLTQTALAHDMYGTDGISGNTVFEFLDIGTAYAKALTGGFAQLTTELLGKDFGSSSGFWKSVLRDIGRARIKYNNFVTQDNPFEALKTVIGKDDKHFAFMNYLAQLGDLAAASGVTGALSFPENKVQLSSVPVTGPARTAGSTSNDRLSMAKLPTMMNRMAALEVMGIGSNVYGLSRELARIPQTHGVSNYVGRHDEDGSELDYGMPEVYNADGIQQEGVSNRWTKTAVERMENHLEAEHMPFYIQDLRTNEIISFHAFLTALSDSYTGEWTAQKGFGRIEAAQIYGGGSRSIGCSFMMVAMNENDMLAMYDRINKLTTLVYPQWSEGTVMSGADNTVFVQPFSQVPTASPLCRIRVGDLFQSNYSIENMARIMGVGGEADGKFNYGSEAELARQRTVAENKAEVAEHKSKQEAYKAWQNAGYLQPNDYGNPTAYAFKLILKKYRDVGYTKTAAAFQKRWDAGVRNDFILLIQSDLEGKHKGAFAFLVALGNEETAGKYYNKKGARLVANTMGGSENNSFFLFPPVATMAEIGNLQRTHGILEINEDSLSTTNPIPDPGNGPQPIEDIPLDSGISALFSKKDGNYSNPILQSFASTMGRGIACAFTGISFDWKLNTAPWDTNPGTRAPRMCEVQLSMVPIHDITPGLDQYGANRAPIYKVGTGNNSLESAGDVWNTGRRVFVNAQVENDLEANLEGKENYKDDEE